MNDKLCKRLRKVAKEINNGPTMYDVLPRRKQLTINGESSVPMETVTVIREQVVLYPHCTRFVYHALKKQQQNSIS